MTRREAEDKKVDALLDGAFVYDLREHYVGPFRILTFELERQHRFFGQESTVLIDFKSSRMKVLVTSIKPANYNDRVRCVVKSEEKRESAL